LRRIGARADFGLWFVGALAVAGILWGTYQFVEPAPPKTLVFAAGKPEGAYHAFAEALADEFAAEGIELIVLETEGSVENLSLLENGSKAKVGFMQSGIGQAEIHTELRGMASVYYEPLWLFTNQDTRLRSIADLTGLTVAAGRPGSGTRQVALQLLADNGLGESDMNLVAASDREATNGLLDGSIDAALTISSADSKMVETLLLGSDTQLMSIRRSEAYARRYPYFSSLSLPEGVVDFGRNIPSEEIKLVAAAATIVAHESLHPALGDLMMRATARVAKRDTLFSTASRFPSSDFLDFPVSDDARRYYKYGIPFLQRYLPFWAANLVDRLKLLALPLVALLLPLSRVLPPAYRWTVRKKVYRWYEEVQTIDQTAENDPSSESLQACLDQLERIEKDARDIEVPLGYAHELYALRHHIDLLNQQIERRILKNSKSLGSIS